MNRVFPEAIDTERLLLHRYRIQDAAAMLALVRDNREQLVREFAQQAALQNQHDAESFVAGKDEQWNTRKAFCYGIWHKASGNLVGQIQLKNIAWDIPSGELGYFIGRSSQRHGYASESVQAIMRSAFHGFGFERIFVRILPSNSGSLALAKKLGFQEEGVHRRAFRCGEGQLHDVRYLSFVTDDYRQQQCGPSSAPRTRTRAARLWR